MEGRLFKHLAEIDQACNERMKILVSAMAEQEGVTEALKAVEQMEWVRQMNACKVQAEEIVKFELIYDWPQDRPDKKYSGGQNFLN